MFNVILELISENRPKRNHETFRTKTNESHERNFIFSVPLNSQSAFLMLLDIEASALLGNTPRL